MSEYDVDFKEVRENFPIEEVAKYLDLDLTEDGDQFRGPCPRCEAGGDRALVISPERNTFTCFVGKPHPRQTKGKYLWGDAIRLTAHILNLSDKEAAQFIVQFAEGRELATQEAKPESAEEEEEKPAKANGFDAVAYAETLDDSAESLESFDISPQLAEAVGWLGRSKKGLNKGKLVVPLRDAQGNLIAFGGVDSITLPKQWRVAS